MDKELRVKYERLTTVLGQLDGVVVAFSGGVDSTLLARVANDVLGKRALAVVGVSDSLPREEALEARKLAVSIGIELVEIDTAEMQNEAYRSNPPDRCFHCKSELFERLLQLANDRGFSTVVDGCNADDSGDYRPGMEAGQRLGVHSPLKEAGLTKQDVRNLSKELGLPTWDKPAMACLSSRIPYGHMITVEKLQRIAEAERFMKAHGFAEVRVRCHEEVARIEVRATDLDRIVNDEEIRTKVIREFKNLGFTYVTVDLQGYRLGSMNETLGVRDNMEVLE